MAINVDILAIASVSSMKIAFVLYEQILATSVALPAEMLLAAADMARARQRKASPDIHFVATRNGAFTSRSGLPLHVNQLIGTQQYDLVYLPALWRNPQTVIRQHGALLPWLQQQHAGGALIGAAGTGVCVLASSGLLDHRPATTHWFYLDRFTAHYPAVDLKPQYLITRAGNLYCAASINALADLTVHFIRHFYGSSIASHVERHFSHEARKSYDNVTYREDDSERHHDEDIIQIQLWLHQHYAQAMQLADVARQFGMSLRNFNRRFLAATGKTPLRYLQGLRIEEGRDLLGNSNLSIAEVAEKVGYQDSSHFSRLFRQTFTVTPLDYRKSMRSKLFSVEPHNA
ncbi:MAG TPA: helix-turn-helix domain-containing protein [Pseudomonadales bacterium]|nr:helix-turn-helix domain-containing protein [Pseudomonadales bacterium]